MSKIRAKTVTGILFPGMRSIAEYVRAERRCRQPRFRLFNWSTRKKGDISEPYGQSSADEMGVLMRAAAELWARKDIYRVELWQCLKASERDPLVEEWHGNIGHLSLTGARMEKKHQKHNERTGT